MEPLSYQEPGKAVALKVSGGWCVELALSVQAFDGTKKYTGQKAVAGQPSWGPLLF